MGLGYKRNSRRWSRRAGILRLMVKARIRVRAIGLRSGVRTWIRVIVDSMGTGYGSYMHDHLYKAYNTAFLNNEKITVIQLKNL